ncbi:TIGR04282 family arsenosugar biosynthesis glycosyltransferase [Candidatus Woesearchaeota archaeon]|nr:TIGR04282 family arsenosugar biosynthesis glycosyltransferase [Candidatus Woesearchaeota archaeon]
MKEIIVVFAKYPEEGKVKTRLGKEIGMEKAANIYKKLLENTIKNTSSKDYDVALCFSPKNKEKEFEELLNIKIMNPQSKGNLGARMKDCFEHFLKDYQKVIIIGSDLPDMNQEIIKESFEILETKDVALGPSTDGGYYLIGMKHLNELFSNIEWSTNTVLKETINKIKKNNLTFTLLKELKDIDKKKDLD